MTRRGVPVWERPFYVLKFSDYSTCNFIAGVTCRLGGKVVRGGVDYNGFFQDIGNGKATGKNFHPGIAIISEQRWQITGMMRMRTVLGIVMHECVGERIACVARATVSAVDVECKDIVSADFGGNGEIVDFGRYKDTLIGLIKIYVAVYVWVSRAS